MKLHFYSDDGPPCHRCKRTSYGYTLDDAVTYIGARCVNCGADNMFYPPKGSRFGTGEEISAAHRKSYPNGGLT